MMQDPTVQQYVTVVATVHGAHFSTNEYPPQFFDLILEQYRPDLVLVEIQPEALAKGELEDSPIEMRYISTIAIQKNIPVAGIDWWRVEDLEALPESLVEVDRIEFENELSEIEGYKNLYRSFSFEYVNSVDFNEAILKIKTIKTAWNQDPTWARRQSNFHKSSLHKIIATGSKRTLIFVGAEHKAELDVFLSWIEGIQLESSLNFTQAIAHPYNKSLGEGFKKELLNSRVRLEKQSIANSNAKLREIASGKLKHVDFVLSKYF